MAKLPILEFPDPRLRIKAATVHGFDARLAQLADDMLETMYAAPGVGLAATQVNHHVRLIVLDCSDDHRQPTVLVNPQILEATGTQVYQEGCLSVPGFCADVTRAAKVRVSAQDVSGQPFELACEGLWAVCVQHEMDHLIGKLFVDYLSPLKRERLRQKLARERGSEAARVVGV